MAKLKLVPKLYDAEIDETRDVTQEDLDGLASAIARMGALRTQLITAMAAAFPRLADELKFGGWLVGKLNSNFYRANGRQPTADERLAEFEKFVGGNS